MQTSLNEDINLSAAARVIYQLGEELISDEFVALAELIKNAYDADSTYVKIEIDTKVVTPNGIGRITIEDNGNGMTQKILTNAFLRISTNFKKIEKFSPYFNRRALGEKGLGRLSIQRLGEHITVETSPRMERLEKIASKEDKEFYHRYNRYTLKLDWTNQFKDDDKDISDVQATCFYEFDNNCKKGTKLIVEGIRNLDFWNFDKKTESRIKTEIFGMVSPFSQKNKQRFLIKINIDGRTISNHLIDEDVLNISSDINVRFKFSDWNLKIEILYKKKYFDRILDKLILSMEKNGFDPPVVKSEYKDYFEEIIIDLENEQYKKDFPYLKEIVFQNIRIDKNFNQANPGDFNGQFYVLDQSAGAIKESLKILSDAGKVFSSHNEVKSIWNAAVGVYIFRNEFRILPYGPRIDWLAFTKRSQREKANAYKEHTVSGYVELDSLTTENIKEQTNRQGIIEDEYGSNFLMLMRETIAEILFQKDTELKKRISIQSFDENSNEISTYDGNVTFTRKRNNSVEREKILRLVDKQINVISNKSEVKNEVKTIIDNLTKLKNIDLDEEKAKQQKYFEYEQKIANLKTLAGLAGQGIIVESLTHELHRIEKNIKMHAKESKQILSRIVKDYPQIKGVVDRQDSILHEILFLNQQLSHLEPTYRKNRVVLQEIDLYNLFSDLYVEKGIMARKAQELNIEVKVIGNNFRIMGNKGVLITIFDNLFLNSLYWLSNYNANTKIITFDLDSIENKIIFYDSGIGINKEIENRLFEPYESLKPEGRGLGLYICKELVKSLKGEITLDRVNKNKEGNYYKFIITF